MLTAAERRERVELRERLRRLSPEDLEDFWARARAAVAADEDWRQLLDGTIERDPPPRGDGPSVVLQVARDLGEPFGPSEMARLTGLQPSSVYDILARLIHVDHAIEKVGPGRYAAIP